jgi:hypothetical protein
MGKAIDTQVAGNERHAKENKKLHFSQPEKVVCFADIRFESISFHSH